ncbi:hypothetical protein KR222_006397, partial [Zaprionus bogoriensis]
SMVNLEQQLQLVNSQLIRFDKDRKEYTTHYNKLRDSIYGILKNEQPLGKWLNGHCLGGDYGDGLKISKPDEFDLVFYLKFPENDRIIVKRDPQRPGNVTLDMTALLTTIQNQEHLKETYASLKKIVNAKNMLLQDKLQDMLNGVFTRTLNKMENQVVVNGRATKLVYKRCGPAHTIFVNEPGMKYSVDFVPSIRLNARQNVLGAEQFQFFKNVSYWDAIPKPLKPFVPNNISFRASYYEAEHNMIQDKQKLKNVIKLMKRFRDNKANMFNLKSYYIKTVLLWQVKERPGSYWVNKQLNEIYIDMFDELYKCLATSSRKGKLQFFWDPNLDMFAGFSENQRREMFVCVNAEIYSLKGSAGNYTDATPDKVKSSFGKKLLSKL